ncbi:diguanylate cyclase [Roseomonas sp. PWR1]|uniref:Diguanylate cyclase n=1 Tax=Roseomonas nitratireducens TaxID=2820810 RepID=A0ABS4ANC2_9PROT|nr:diguanylate cyclase [Neoroseomonas nitratireducens]MBP0462865.1 diguanylate cyclase [Neoroseomonas nitratireducens]
MNAIFALLRYGLDMFDLGTLHHGLQAILLLLIIAAAGVALRAALLWHQRPRRFALALAGAGVILLSGLPRALDLATLAAPPAAWHGWLSLLPDAALPVVILILLRIVRRQDAARIRAARTRRVNPATDLPNRLHLPPLLLPALARCRRDGSPMVLVAATPDGLADIAALHGPAAAEAMLRGLADALRDATRAGDLAGHLAPDSLMACLPGTGRQAARVVAERVRARAAARLPHPAMDGRRSTVSLAIAEIGDGAAPAALEEAMAAAEAALALARAKGGDAIETAPPPPPRRPRPVPAPADAVTAVR